MPLRTQRGAPYVSYWGTCPSCQRTEPARHSISRGNISERHCTWINLLVSITFVMLWGRCATMLYQNGGGWKDYNGNYRPQITCCLILQKDLGQTEEIGQQLLVCLTVTIDLCGTLPVILAIKLWLIWYQTWPLSDAIGLFVLHCVVVYCIVATVVEPFQASVVSCLSIIK